jgi:hypothetical protein
LVPEQFGFRKGISIEKAIFTLTNNILNTLNQHEQIGGIFCDLTKAFDCVIHKILISKLYHYGIRGVNALWFEYYLLNRRQKIEITLQNKKENLSSSWGIIKSGVPQGSILGPILFLIYINDLPLGINTYSKPVLFADDLSILIAAKNLNDLQTRSLPVLTYMSKWFAANGLSLNIDKTSVIKFNLSHFQEDSLQIFYRNKLIKEETNVRFLGLGIDKHLNWKTHIAQVISKLSSACYAVRSLFYFSTKDSLRMITLHIFTQ